MSSVPGVDRPVEQTEAEITLSGRGLSVTGLVEQVQGAVVVVRPSVGEVVDRLWVTPGEGVELLWHNAEGQRALPAEVEGVETAVGVRWRLRATGPAQASQRRNAVRGRVTADVRATCEGIVLSGQTLDLSEAGMRADFNGFGLPPEAGGRLDLVISLEDGDVGTKAEVVRTQVRGPVWRMSLRFVAMPEREQDHIRRRVFQALREERARIAGNR